MTPASLIGPVRRALARGAAAPAAPLAALGVAALAGAAALVLGLTPQWRAQTQAADQAVHRIARQNRLLSITEATEATEAAARADGPRWLRALPPVERVPQRVADMLTTVQRHGLALRALRQASGADPLLPAAVLSMQLQGAYPALRRCVAELLAHDDALALDRLQISRPLPQADRLSADLQWTLFSRSQPGLALPLVGRLPSPLADKPSNAASGIATNPPGPRP